MANNNPFYVCEKYYLLMFETAIAATKAVSDELSLHQAIEATKLWAEKTGSPITFSRPEEVILLIEKQNKQWKVIIGEKIGWITTEIWQEIKSLESPNDED